MKDKFLYYITFIETLITVFIVTYFNYLSSLSYEKINIQKSNGLILLIQNMYQNTWWSLILLVLVIINILNIMSLIYKDNKYVLINILLISYLSIIALDFNKSLFDNVTIFFIFIPILYLYYLRYKKIKNLN